MRKLTARFNIRAWRLVAKLPGCRAFAWRQIDYLTSTRWGR
jgi:hypothetical protein